MRGGWWWVTQALLVVGNGWLLSLSTQGGLGQLGGLKKWNYLLSFNVKRTDRDRIIVLKVRDAENVCNLNNNF